MRQVTIRVQPNQDLRKAIEDLVQEYGIRAGVVASMVGSLSIAKLRMADGKTIQTREEPFEIVSATGTVSRNGIHIHASVSDMNGNVFGGHLSMGCIVRTTAEVSLLIFDDVVYKRIEDKQTGYEELDVEKRQNNEA